MPVPGFISNLKYLAAHKDWNGSFVWLTQFIRENASKFAQAKLFGALATALFGGIMLFAQGDEQGGEEECDEDYEYEDDEKD